MKPKPQFLSQEVSKQTLETSLDESFDVNSLNVVRYNSGEKPKFAVLTKWRGLEELGIRDIETDANSLPELLESGILEKMANKEENYLGEIKTIEENEILNPITPKNIIGLAYNYFEHAKEVGETEKFKGKNMVAFRKDTSSLSGAFDNIVKPDEVRLLDYEVELGIVLGKKIDRNTEITKKNFQDFIAGYVLTNDISARDIQLKEGTLLDKAKGFRKGKSYDGFCPTGPIFLYSSKNLDFTLNQYLERQNKIYKLQEGNSSEMINSPCEILKELQRRLISDNKKEYRAFIDEKRNRNYSLEPGDLILTGTPAGVAFNFNVKYVIACGGKNGFIKFEEKNNEKYLRQGDMLITQAKSLGYQKHKIR